MNAITMTGLTKRYGNVTAVDHLGLDIRKGELFGLLGVNGAGKTTTIKMLSCLIKPSSGEAFVLGDSILQKPFAIKQRINISPQETAVAPNLSVRENLEMIAGIYGQKHKECVQRAADMASRLGLDSVMKRKAKVLSSGMQRRLSIALALISDPEVLFLDEPTLGLDVLARRELWRTIENLKGKITMILTSHYLEEVEALSDRVGVLSEGKLVAVGTVHELLTQTGTSKFEDAFVALAGGVQ